MSSRRPGNQGFSSSAAGLVFHSNLKRLPPGCANGCNIMIDECYNKVGRLFPRRNDAVNDTWMCGAGGSTIASSASPTGCGNRCSQVKKVWRQPRGSKRALRRQSGEDAASLYQVNNQNPPVVPSNECVRLPPARPTWAATSKGANRRAKLLAVISLRFEGKHNRESLF
jgi:hypothetical protein